MKKAFTMIELVFVIVILGILAMVALPKFLGVAGQAHEANLKAFVGTLNRTVGPEIWAQHVGDGGSIKAETSAKKYVDIPKEIGHDFGFGNCGDGTFQKIVESDPNVTGQKYEIDCEDGTASSSPAFILKDSNGKCIAGPCP